MTHQKIHLYPHIRKRIGDLETPLTAYLKCSSSQSFLLESVSEGEHVGRYSFIGIDPMLQLIKDRHKVTVIDTEATTQSDDGAIDTLEAIMHRYEMVDHPDLPPFIGGAVGFFSWNIISEIEPNVSHPKPSSNDTPDAHFMLPRSIIAFDHAKREMILMSLGSSDNDPEAISRLEHIESQLASPLLNRPLAPPSSPDALFESIASNYDSETFKDHIEHVKQHIYDGDIFQLVLSQKFQVSLHKDPIDIYRHLRLINPSPYMFFLNFGSYHIIGSSPEILVKLQGKNATVRPIAGTRPRVDGKDVEMRKELLADTKEIAEHLMLVDLGRNDLGRVCEYGSVETNELMSIETYSHVLHMVTNVSGTLKKDATAFDLFRATFPAGTLSGAPKISAIDIINRLEPEGRGIYGGALGYVDFRGNMDLCIIIRTILAKDRIAYIQAGAGLVADSDPQKELEESRNKARGMVHACF